MDFDVRRPSRQLTLEDAVQIQKRIFSGEFNHRIAADYDVNQGRISEIRTGKRYPESRELALKELGATASKPPLQASLEL